MCDLNVVTLRGFTLIVAWLVACSPAHSKQPERKPEQVVSANVDAGPTRVSVGVPPSPLIEAKPKPEPPEPALNCAADTTRVGGGPPSHDEAYCQLPSGGRHGPYVSFADDGHKQWTGQYQSGVKHGTWTQYAPKRKVLGRYTMNMGTGTELRWYDNGTKAEETQVKDGERHGKRLVYDMTGTLMTTEHYKRGALHGSRTSGTKEALALEEHYYEGKLHNRRRVYYEKRLLLEEHYWRGVLNGTWKSARFMGQKRDEGTYKAGRKVGTWTTYYRDGSVWMEGTHNKRGRLDGPWKATHWEGQVLQQGAYKDGQKDGEWKTFNDKGELLGSYTMKNGTGVEVTWYKNKRVASRVSYYRGRRTGRSRVYHQSGRMLLETRYRWGRRHGAWLEWHRNGRRKVVAQFKNDQPTGTWKRWYADGKLAAHHIYKDGQLNGRWVEYFHDGRKESAGRFVADKREGVWTYWYVGGIKSIEATWKNGALDGSYKSYYESGKLRAAGEYANGKRVGTWQSFNEDGSVKK